MFCILIMLAQREYHEYCCLPSVVHVLADLECIVIAPLDRVASLQGSLMQPLSTSSYTPSAPHQEPLTPCLPDLTLVAGSDAEAC